MNKVSCLIPCYNMDKWLPAAVESVVNQTRKVDEILIWDDGSTDGSRQAAEELALRYPNVRTMGWDQNRGGGIAFKRMIESANGEFLLPFAADDLLEPQYVEKCLAEFEAHPSALMVACHPTFIDENGDPYTDTNDIRLKIPKPINRPREQFRDSLKIGNQYFGTGMYRASTFVRCGSFDNDLKWLSDWDYYLRLLAVGDIRIVEEPLCKYRLHPGALSVITKDKLPEQARMVRLIRERHFQPKEKKLILATPFYMNLCFSNYKSCMVATTDYLTKKGINWSIMDLNGDSYVDRAKNTIANKFLESDGTDLIYIDSDMTWAPQSVERILQWDQEVVAGAFPMKNNWDAFVGEPKLSAQGQSMGFALSDGSWLLQARRVAGGFLRIKRSALVKFADFYPDRIYIDVSSDPACPGRIYTDFFECIRKDYTRYGEDMAFSELCLQAGIDLYIDPNITFGHYGVKCWEGNYHEYLKAVSEKNMNSMNQTLYPAPVA